MLQPTMIVATVDQKGNHTFNVFSGHRMKLKGSMNDLIYFIAFASSEIINIAVKIYRPPNGIFHEKNENRGDQEASNSVHLSRFGR